MDTSHDCKSNTKSIIIIIYINKKMNEVITDNTGTLVQAAEHMKKGLGAKIHAEANVWKENCTYVNRL